MQIYIAQSEADYEVPEIYGYYPSQQAAEIRLAEIREYCQDQGMDLGRELVVREVTVGSDITPIWFY